jgi:hypothetical protein
MERVPLCCPTTYSIPAVAEGALPVKTVEHPPSASALSVVTTTTAIVLNIIDLSLQVVID